MPLGIHSSLMNYFNKVIFLHFCNELKFHILSTDGNILRLSPGIKISISSQKADIAPLMSTTAGMQNAKPSGFEIAQETAVCSLRDVRRTNDRNVSETVLIFLLSAITQSVWYVMRICNVYISTSKATDCQSVKQCWIPVEMRVSNGISNSIQCYRKVSTCEIAKKRINFTFGNIKIRCTWPNS